MDPRVQSILDWCYHTAHRVPHPGYCTGPNRFGPTCYDCSGFTYMAYKSIGLTIPADSAAVANWGRNNHQARPIWEAQPGDLMIHDKYGDPYHSQGARGHIGILSATPPATWESAGSGKGAGIYNRGLMSGFWCLAVRHPALTIPGQTTKPPLPVKKKDDMQRLIKGDQKPEVYLTNWIDKRWVQDQAEVNAIIAGGITDGAPPVKWPQAFVDRIPLRQ